MRDIVGISFPSQDERAARGVAAARDWCRTSPDHAAIEQLAATLGGLRGRRKTVISTGRSEPRGESPS